MKDLNQKAKTPRQRGLSSNQNSQIHDTSSTQPKQCSLVRLDIPLTEASSIASQIPLAKTKRSKRKLVRRWAIAVREGLVT